MNEIAPEEKIDRLQNRVRFAGAETDRCLIELRLEVDHLRLELTALKQFMTVSNPSFAEQFPQILEKAIHEVDPESH
ncbi:MAG: hypothetical protein A2X84_14645 [Desulfuromonadaceae bacterium GWC2_58_13]|nr:MAG: hypothetical protein A2X84_14645 [Desulfuromonadaceae bacterium GWC2_58_13]